MMKFVLYIENKHAEETRKLTLNNDEIMPQNLEDYNIVTIEYAADDTTYHLTNFTNRTLTQEKIDYLRKIEPAMACKVRAGLKCIKDYYSDIAEFNDKYKDLTPLELAKKLENYNLYYDYFAEDKNGIIHFYSYWDVGYDRTSLITNIFRVYVYAFEEVEVYNFSLKDYLF